VQIIYRIVSYRTMMTVMHAVGVQSYLLVGGSAAAGRDATLATVATDSKHDSCWQRRVHQRRFPATSCTTARTCADARSVREKVSENGKTQIKCMYACNVTSL